MARAMNQDTYHAWDRLAPAPEALTPKESARMNFPDALKTVKAAFSQMHPEMGEFVELMADKSWIEARILPTKRPGAYCTGFVRSREPRVFMTFDGQPSDVSTLAHELGHAFHSWVMRDLPDEQIDYPMTLAETASNVGELLLAEQLDRQASSPDQLLPLLWNELQAGAAYLVNIPMRFEFERNFYEKRKNGLLTAGDLCKEMEQAQEIWYGSSMTPSDPYFWASKLHFHITGLSFYNFPYLFGYLFGLGVYAKWKAEGDSFYPAYVALLRDTGRMSAEELAQKHMGVDLTKPDFWNASIAILEKRVERFESILNK